MTLKNAAEAALVRALFAVSGALSVDRASAAGAALARRLGPLTRLDRIARANMALALPDLGGAETDRAVAGMWDNLGRTVAEYAHLPTLWERRDTHIEIVGEDLLRSVAGWERPAFVFSAHIANWEVMPIVGRRLGMGLTFVYRAPNNDQVATLLDRARRRASLAPPEAMVPKGPAGARDLLKALKGGGSIGMLVDQKLNDGIAVPFFGQPAMTAPAIAELALRSQGILLPVRCERLDGPRFRVTAEEPWEIARTGDKAADILAAMTRVNAIVERWVADRPDQWLWVHRRWPQSKGETLPARALAR